MSKDSVKAKLLEIQKCKQDIKKALESKGIDMSNVPLHDYPNKIKEAELDTTIIWDWTKENGIISVCLGDIKINSTTRYFLGDYPNLVSIHCGTVDFKDSQQYYFIYGLPKLQHIHGTFKNIERVPYGGIPITENTELTKESLLVIFNGLYDYSREYRSYAKIIINEALKDRVDSECLQIITSKNWEIEWRNG